MARRKLLSAYPREYPSLIREANKRTLTIPHETRAQAEATRNDLYTYRSVLYQEQDADFAELQHLAQNVRFSIEDTTLIAEPIIKGKTK